MRKFMVSFLVGLSLLIPFSVSALEDEITNDVSVSLKTVDMKINVGETKHIEYSLEGADDLEFSVSFVNADPKIASVSSQGVVKGLLNGTTSVEVIVEFEDESIETLHGNVAIEVVDVPAKLSFSKKDVSIVRNSSYTIELTLETGTTGSDVIWDSSDPLVASVVNGVVKAHKVGKTVISARVGDVEATMQVVVTVPLERMEFNPKQVRLKVSEEISIPSLVFVPYDTTTNKKAIYTVDDESIAVLNNGKLIGLKSGTTAVIAKIGKVTAVLNVVVELDEEVSNNFVVDFNVVSKDDDALVLKSGSLVNYRVGKVDVNFPIDDILSYMDNREVTKVRIVFDEKLAKDNFSLLKSIVVPKDVFLLLGAQKLEIDLVDHEGIVWASYFFNSRTKEDIDLKVVTKLIDAKSNLIAQTGGQTAYHLMFNEKQFPSSTYVRLNTNLFNRVQSDYYFLYENVGDTLTYTNQQTAPQENFVRFLVEGNDYVVSFNRFASGQNKGMLYGLMVLVGIILAAIGVRSFKKIINK